MRDCLLGGGKTSTVETNDGFESSPTKGAIACRLPMKTDAICRVLSLREAYVFQHLKDSNQDA